MPRQLARNVVPLLLLPALSWASAEREAPKANIRPCFDAGYTSPERIPGFDDGLGLGAALEFEHARAASLLFHLEWDLLFSTGRSAFYPYYQSSISGETFYLTWSVGARGYLRPAATLRPYGELDIGVRTGYAEALICAPRIGIAWAAHGGSGLQLETGVKFTTRDPKRYLTVPIRIGIVFP